jgi:hypothetical protein
MNKVLYVNNSDQDIRDFHGVILEAIKNDGVFSEDYVDIFQLARTPEGSYAEWILDFTD